MDTILDKIDQLRKYFAGNRADRNDISSIDNWYSKAKELLLIKALKENPGIKYVTEIFESEVQKINEQLLSHGSDKLSDYQRDRLIDRRDLASKYLTLFVEVDDKLSTLEEKVDVELNNNSIV